MGQVVAPVYASVFFREKAALIAPENKNADRHLFPFQPYSPARFGKFGSSVKINDHTFVFM
jgi:hypothetical protein